MFFIGGNAFWDFIFTAGITFMVAVFANYISIWLRVVKGDVIEFLEGWIAREKFFNKVVQAGFITFIGVVVLSVIYVPHF